MIYHEQFDRYSFNQLKSFWGILEELKGKYAHNSTIPDVINRDKVAFQIMYSYGLSPNELLMLKYEDIDINSNEQLFKCILINECGRNRIIYPIFIDAFAEIEMFLKRNISKVNNPSNFIFTTETNKPISKCYLNHRLKYYNSYLSDKDKLFSLYIFRQLYIADLLRLKDISLTFIYKQSGTSLVNNHLYDYLY
ncbi:MAG TPA: tyrosine-type recombinase/integrase [Clostridia bacterium]|nr:tyrosine-type recombinase/integrase [Clostridia bacterium]